MESQRNRTSRTGSCKRRPAA